jgi:hypothetical protein
LCDRIDTVTPPSGKTEMIQKVIYSLLLWMGGTVTLILAIDFAFSMYKITEFREAVANISDFVMVLVIYLIAFVAAVVTCICYLHNLMKNEASREWMEPFLTISIGLNGLLLLLNILPLHQWSNLALERKNFSLFVSMAFGILLVFLNRRPGRL